MSHNTHHVTDGNFHDFIQPKGEKLVLVDLWAPWCGPCKALAPVLEALAAQFGGDVRIGKLNIDENPATPKHYSVRGIPTLLFFHNGKLVKTNVGMRTQEELTTLLEGLIKSNPQ